MPKSGVARGRQWGLTFLLKVTPSPFEIPRAVLVDTETGEGSGSGKFLANEVCPDQKLDILGAENSLSRFEVPWFGLGLG